MYSDYEKLKSIVLTTSRWNLKSYKSTVGVRVNTAKQHSLCLKNIWLWSFSVTLPTENFHAETL